MTREASKAVKGNESGSEDDGEDLEWPSETDIVVGEKGIINLTAQHQAIQDLLRKSFSIVYRDLVLVNAYPDLTRKSEYIRKALLEAATELKLDPIIYRLKTDRTYARRLSSTVIIIDIVTIH